MLHYFLLAQIATSFSTRTPIKGPNFLSLLPKINSGTKQPPEKQPASFGDGLAESLGGSTPPPSSSPLSSMLLSQNNSKNDVPTSHVRYRITDYQQQQLLLPRKSLSRLQKLSNFASLLCVLDCTLLPVATIFTPFLSSSSLHHLGHLVALRFVLPVGAMNASFNFYQNRQWKLTALALVGMTLIGLTNSSLIAAEFLHHGWSHRIINIIGCLFLLTSNIVSQRMHDKGNCFVC